VANGSPRLVIVPCLYDACRERPPDTYRLLPPRATAHARGHSSARVLPCPPSRSAGESFYHVTKILGGGVRKLEREEIEPFVSSKPAETLRPRKRQTSSQLNCYVTYLNIENSSGSN
jgi:hypothetical protein